jgi:hypothetical protein
VDKTMTIIGDLKTAIRMLKSGQCPQGLQIHLEDNDIGAAGAEAIAGALEKIPGTTFVYHIIRLPLLNLSCLKA